MNLDAFISESLLEVLKGIKDAQEITNKRGAGVGVINPKWETRRITTTTSQKLPSILLFLPPNRRAVVARQA